MDTELDAIVQKYGKQFPETPSITYLRMYFTRDISILRLIKYCEESGKDLELVGANSVIHVSKDGLAGDSALNEDKKLLEQMLKKLPAPQL